MSRTSQFSIIGGGPKSNFLPSIFLLLVSLALALSPTARAQRQPAQASVHAVRGSATCFVSGSWQPLQKDSSLGSGAIVKTPSDTIVDVLLVSSGTVLRVMPDSVLRFDCLEQMPGADRALTTTRLDLLSGGLVGSQRKLPAGSEFAIRLPNGVVRIVGTEYSVHANGAVTCFHGAVSMTHTGSGNGAPIKVAVGAGFSFDPTKGQVVATSAASLERTHADVEAVRDNARTLKSEPSKEDRDHDGDRDHTHHKMSPVKPGHDHDHDHDHDHEQGGDHNQDDGHGGGHGDHGH